MAQLQIVSPHRFKERILLFGGGGAGKTNAVCNMARYMPYATFHVGDTDISQAYDRALATEYQDVDERGNMHVQIIVPEWEAYKEWAQRVVREGDPTTDVLVIDNGTAPWTWVQNWYGEKALGIDIVDAMMQMQKDSKNKSEFSKAMSETMNWPLINKEFQRGFYAPLHAWRGHFIIVCEAAVTRKDDDEDEKLLYGSLGAKPKGNGTLHHVAASNLLLMQRPRQGKRDVWAISTAKDRGRPKQERTEMDEFAIDYLVGIGGWDQERVR